MSRKKEARASSPSRGASAEPLASRVRRHGEDLRRIGILLVTAVLCAILVADFARVPTDSLSPGDIAPRTVEASQTFQYTDFASQQELRDEARRSVLPVYVHRADLTADLESRVSAAFDAARQQAASAGPAPMSADHRSQIAQAFSAALGVHVPDEDVATLIDAGFPAAAEELSIDLLGQAMRSYVVADRDELPPDHGALRIIELDGAGQAGGGGRDELTMSDPSTIRTPAEARQQVSIALLEKKSAGPWADAAATIARACVRPNLTYDAIETRERQEASAAGVPVDAMTVKRGTILFRKGDVLTSADVEKYRALQRTGTGHGVLAEIAAVSFFLVLLLGALYTFGATWLHGFSTKARDAAAVGSLLVLVALLARVIVATSDGFASVIGMEATPESIWFAVPVAGAAMLVRLLVGTGWSVVFAMAAGTVCGLEMDLQALHVVFFVLSAIVGAGSVEHTRERMSVIRAGLFTAVVSAAAVLLIHFLQLFVGDQEVSLATTMRPVWSMTSAFVGGLSGSFLVLGLMPLFEGLGFVTDYKLMELANLNHPLMRQLMLRAPGSYHHSVVVGTLAEAACEAVGANALQARVAAYFHDIGKALKPQYFIENQRNTVNRHETLDPHHSARVIISHVVEGGRMAREHKLPQPILDNIYMHHGTGLLSYFYEKARAAAADPDKVSIDDFKYPGPKPNTRESGIIMLADKVEAATRTIREPSEENIRAMINQIINSVMADGQFEDCPLTFQEIYTIADTFVQVLLGIYHQRIEYPQTRAISRATKDDATRTPDAAAPRKNAAVITLEIPSPLRKKTGTDDDATEDTGDPDTDYESVQNLPKR